MSAAELILLGLLKEKSRYPYEIAEEIELRNIQAWAHIGFSSIYYTLHSLEKRKMVYSKRRDSSDGPDRRVYAITKRGEYYLKEKTVELLGDTIPVPSRFYAGLSLIKHLDISDLREVFRDHRTKIRSRLDEIEASEHPEASFEDRIMFNLDRALAQAELEWIHDVLRDEALGGQ
jgi:DNA-binding PadR family transcriptional regulator